jgi:hypothetical protein
LAFWSRDLANWPIHEALPKSASFFTKLRFAGLGALHIEWTGLGLLMPVLLVTTVIVGLAVLGQRRGGFWIAIEGWLAGLNAQALP